MLTQSATETCTNSADAGGYSLGMVSTPFEKKKQSAGSVPVRQLLRLAWKLLQSEEVTFVGALGGI